MPNICVQNAADAGNQLIEYGIDRCFVCSVECHTIHVLRKFYHSFTMKIIDQFRDGCETNNKEKTMEKSYKHNIQQVCSTFIKCEMSIV